MYRWNTFAIIKYNRNLEEKPIVYSCLIFRFIYVGVNKKFTICSLNVRLVLNIIRIKKSK